MSKPNARRLFGTDGIRGVAGEPPLDAASVYAIGLALGRSLSKMSREPNVILGRDTRESSQRIAATVIAGMRKSGIRVHSAGVVPTPAVAFLARAHGFHAGVVISASHNPWRDNGIKLFGGNGFKFPDAFEFRLEDDIQRAIAEVASHDVSDTPKINDQTELGNEYAEFLLSCVPELNLGRLRVVVDCANGAAVAIAPELFRKLGGEIICLNTEPNGRNINEGCGALHPDWVAREVVTRNADVGVTFDGDADRCMLAGMHSNVVNGDAILLMAARDLKARGMLTGDLVVATTMSNMGLEAALKRSGIQMLRAPVGDRYVLEQMQQHNAALGGEQSGHILFPHLATTGDGLLTALVVLDLIARTGRSVDELTADLKVFPQVIMNIQVREKVPLESVPSVAEKICSAEQDLKDSGRVVIRYSGTERLARVMIEAENEEMMKFHANEIANAIRNELGE